MVKIFDIQQQLNNITNHRSKVIEFESFQAYLESLEETYKSDNYTTYSKHIDFSEQSVVFMYEFRLISGTWLEFTHFAKVIN